MRALVFGALVVALPAHAQPGPIATSLESIASSDPDQAALVPAESPACGCCSGVVPPPACPRPPPSRGKLETFGLAMGIAWGAGLGLSSQPSAEKALGPFRPIDAGLTIASAVTGVLLHQKQRTCDAPSAGKPGGLDGWARRTFKAKTVCGEDLADDASYFTGPASLAAPFAFALTTRDPQGTRDALVVLESNAIAGLLVQVAKRVAPRRRPYAEFCEPTPTTNLCAASANKSFFSGHAAVSFSSAVASGTIASMRGQKRAGWVWATGLSVATTTSILRMSADRHHFSDVLVGIGVGSLVGWAVPHFHRTRDLGPEPGARYEPPAPQLSFTIRF